MTETVKPFVPTDFRVPECRETAEFRLRMPTVHAAVAGAGRATSRAARKAHAAVRSTTVPR